MEKLFEELTQEEMNKICEIAKIRVEVCKMSALLRDLLIFRTNDDYEKILNELKNNQIISNYRISDNSTDIILMPIFDKNFTITFSFDEEIE